MTNMSQILESQNLYIIFGEDSFANKGMANILKLKIKELFFGDNNIIDPNDYIIIDLHKDINQKQILDYIDGTTGIKKNIVFVSLYVDGNIAQSKTIIDYVRLNRENINLYYLNEILNIDQILQ